VADVLESETRKPLAELQREDLFLLGRLLLMLGTRAPVMAPQAFPQVSYNIIIYRRIGERRGICWVVL
jgi:hypothetical protein